MGAPSTDSVWRKVRGLRHRPPGAASTTERRAVFGAALEQAEQLFSAAKGVGYASRPLLLFYALSQAGRAVAAASRRATNDAWQLESHGIKADLANIRNLASISVQDKGRGSFTQLAPLVGSGSLAGGVPLGKIWASIPELSSVPLTSAGMPSFPALSYVHHQTASDVPDQEMRYIIYGWLVGLPARLLRKESEEKFATFLSNYPTLAGAQEAGTVLNRTVRRSDGLSFQLSRKWVAQGKESAEELQNRLTVAYLGDDVRYAFPAFDGGKLPLHPFLAWWAVLYTLSMIARYEPSEWVKVLDIDANPDAAAVEHALDRALDVVPELIYYVIRAA
ncbi:YaaC family protein [Streptomyces lydicus]|uniref:YaaC family protein n=1 Tax=Streptomyces lydicus TaxID=47763 RepID=UPI00378B911A